MYFLIPDMRYYFKILILFANFIYSTEILSAGTLEVSVPDTSINRGGINNIGIKIDALDVEGRIIESVFEYNAYVLDIKDHFETEDAILDSFRVTSDLTNIEKAILTVKLYFKQNIQSTVANIFVEGLAGADTTTVLKPVKVLIDDSDFSESVFREGRINVKSFAVVPGISEGLGQNRPNPFSDYTTFPFGINKDSEINFSVFGLSGRRILDDSGINKIFKVLITNEQGETIEDYNGVLLKRGNYTLTLQPYSWELSSGAYYIVLKTESGVYKTNFMYIK
ncbi:MAG: hypothetical protein WC313_05330 [Candidatus Kapaibacterium sp.]